MKIIPLWVKLLVLAGAALLVLATLKACKANYDEGVRQEGRDEVQQKWDKDTAERAAAALAEAQANAKETQRRLERQQENQRAQDALVAQLRRDADAADAAVARLRQRTAAYLDAAGCGALTGDSALECVRAAAAKVGIVLGQCAARHRQLAADADDARARGLKCEADYDALTPTTERKP